MTPKSHRDQFDRLPHYPRTSEPEDKHLQNPEFRMLVAIHLAWLVFFAFLFTVFWFTSSIYAVSTLHSGSSGVRIHLFGLLIQEEGYFFPDTKYRHSGISFGEIVFNVVLLSLVLAVLYHLWRVIVTLIRIWPRGDG